MALLRNVRFWVFGVKSFPIRTSGTCTGCLAEVWGHMGSVVMGTSKGGLEERLRLVPAVSQLTSTVHPGPACSQKVAGPSVPLLFGGNPGLGRSIPSSMHRSALLQRAGALYHYHRVLVLIRLIGARVDELWGGWRAECRCRKPG